MHFALPTSGLDLPCAVPNFMGIHVVKAQPAYAVYLFKMKIDRNRKTLITNGIMCFISNVQEKVYSVNYVFMGICIA